MGIKNLLSKTNKWMKSRTESVGAGYEPLVDSHGLLGHETMAAEPQLAKKDGAAGSKLMTVQSVPSVDKVQSLEKLESGFNELVSQLKGINDNLDKHAEQQQDLIVRMGKIPELMENFPQAIANQQVLTQQLADKLDYNSTKDQQFIEVVERIPAETAKQTDALTSIDHQLAAAADSDVQMAESFNKFNESINKLDQTAASQTDGIMQMSKTFATSDRYLKYLMTQQNKRFMWLFITSIAICTAAIIILAGIVVYLLK